VGLKPRRRHQPVKAAIAYARRQGLQYTVQGLVREIPEAMKPRRISISGSSASNVRQIDGKAA
jgi:hypothetical protein